MLNKTIFNTEKTDYSGNIHHSLFLGEAPGLFDTVNKLYPKIWDNYKNMKSLDWDELEFADDFKTCNTEFKTCPTSISDRMIKTLAWQWEADSVAARTVLPVMAPFISSPELQAAYGRITDNEVLHAATYSEIVRYSFDDPRAVLDEVLKVKEAMQRLKGVSEVFAELYKASHEYALGLRENNQELYNTVIMGVVAMLVLERIQFMASFAVTFAIGQTGSFMPIAKSVQKICQDEFEVHVDLGKIVLTHEFQTERGKIAYQQLKPRIHALIKEVINLELDWVDYLLGDGEPLVGLTPALLKSWVLHAAGDVYRILKLEPDASFKIPSKNPLPYMANWMDISKTQAAPQEQQNGQYKVNIIQRNDSDKVYAVDF